MAKHKPSTTTYKSPGIPLHRLWIHCLHTVHLTEFACTSLQLYHRATFQSLQSVSHQCYQQCYQPSDFSSFTFKNVNSPFSYMSTKLHVGANIYDNSKQQLTQYIPLIQTNLHFKSFTLSSICSNCNVVVCHDQVRCQVIPSSCRRDSWTHESIPPDSAIDPQVTSEQVSHVLWRSSVQMSLGSPNSMYL